MLGIFLTQDSNLHLLVFFRTLPSDKLPTIMFNISWDFLMVEQIFFHHKWNEAWLLVMNWYMRIALRDVERIKIWILGN